jgi:hypothetical protein
LGYLQGQGDYFKHNVAIDQITGVPAGKLVDGLDFWKNDKPMWKAKGQYSLNLYRNATYKVISTYASKHDTPEKREDHPLFAYIAHQTVSRLRLIFLASFVFQSLNTLCFQSGNSRSDIYLLYSLEFTFRALCDL